MNIVFCKWKCICEAGISDSFIKLGHNIISFDEESLDNDYDTKYLTKFVDFTSGLTNIDFVFTANYLPIIARACKLLKIPYVSWIIDCPLLTLFSETISYPTNYIFVFDKFQAEQIEPYNKGHIFYLPLGCDTNLYDSLTITPDDALKYTHDVSFVGSLYSEKNANKYDLFTKELPEYLIGYINGLIAAQQNLLGYDVIYDSISDEFCDEFIKYSGIKFRPDYYNNKKYFISQYMINYKCTEIERKKLLNDISQNHNINLYTLSDSSMLPKVINHGPADSRTVMPKIFNLSKINLNITLRSIQTGIPLRIYDVLGCGGFLITNYQSELTELFTPGEDLVMYESHADLLEKIDYYLTHEDERMQIAYNGYNKVHTEHSLISRVSVLLSILSKCNLH